MAKNTINIVIKAVTGGFEAAMSRGGKAVEAFRHAAGDSTRVFSTLSATIGGVVGAIAGFQGLRSAVNIMQEASAAGYNMEASLKAASREFDNIGGVEHWNEAIGRLSGQLAIYSDTALRGAVSRTVDMTKRLGLSAEQMEQVIALTGDLSAGKTDLEGGIERVTAALRGEAEASEYLGLTLNENYVKSWYEARGATQGAWKDLTDLEKAQIRYNVFLEQAMPMQGRAAESVSTLGGAIQLVRKEIENAIVNNEGAVQAAKNLAEVIRDNAGSIGQLVSGLITAAAYIAQFVAANHQAIAIVGAFAVGVLSLIKVFQGISLTIGIVKGLRAALLELTGINLAGWAKTAITQLNGLRGALAAIPPLLRSISALGAAAFIGWEIGTFLNQFDFVQKAAQKVIYTLDKLRLTAMKMWAALTGGDVAEIEHQLAIAKQAYEDGIAEIENKNKRQQTQEHKAELPEKKVVDPKQESWEKYLKDQEEALAGDEKEKISKTDKKEPKNEKTWLEERYAAIDQRQRDRQPVRVYGDDGKWTYHYGPQDGLVEQDGRWTRKEPEGTKAEPLEHVRQSNGWTRIEQGGRLVEAAVTSALEAVPKLVRQANGWSRIEKDPVQQEKAKQSGAKVVELKFKGGTLSGGESDVEALLRQLEEAGLRA